MSTTTTEIGSLKERVTIIDAPTPGPNGRIGRMRHANGENVDIDFDTLKALEQRAKTGPEDCSPEVPLSVLYA